MIERMISQDWRLDDGTINSLNKFIYIYIYIYINFWDLRLGYLGMKRKLI